MAGEPDRSQGGMAIVRELPLSPPGELRVGLEPSYGDAAEGAEVRVTTPEGKTVAEAKVTQGSGVVFNGLEGLLEVMVLLETGEVLFENLEIPSGTAQEVIFRRDRAPASGARIESPTASRRWSWGSFLASFVYFFPLLALQALVLLVGLPGLFVALVATDPHGSSEIPPPVRSGLMGVGVLACLSLLGTLPTFFIAWRGFRDLSVATILARVILSVASVLLAIACFYVALLWPAFLQQDR